MGQKRGVCVGEQGKTDNEGGVAVQSLLGPSCVTSSATAETLVFICISVRGYKQLKRGLAYSTLPIAAEFGPLNTVEEL